MEKPAARVTDLHTCPTHEGGRVLAPGAQEVLIGDRHAARVGDECDCGHKRRDKIVKGAWPVRVEGKPAARQDDHNTAHGGSITEGCANVLIGLAGTSGNVLAGIRRCKAMAAGRQPAQGDTRGGNPIQSNTAGQSYNNCGLESARQLIQQAASVRSFGFPAFGKPDPATISQEDLRSQAVDAGLASSGVPYNEATFRSGGSTSAAQAQLMTNNGVPATALPSTMDNVEDAVGDGRGVIAAVDASRLPAWQGPNGTPITPPGSWHAVTVIGVEYDDDGNPVNVIINDTGVGHCGDKVPYATFKNAFNAYAFNHSGTVDPNQPPVNGVAATDDPIW